MPRKRGKQVKGVAELSGPPTRPQQQVHIRATSPPATPAPKRVKWVGLFGDLREEGDLNTHRVEKTADELLAEWTAVMEKEWVKLKEAYARVRMLEEELEEVEEKWTAKLEDAVEEIGLLKKEKEEGMAAANEKLAAVSAECKGRRKEIAPLRGAIANMKKGKRDKEVEKAVQTEVTEVLVAGTQTERRTYASILAQTEEVSIGGETTDRMDIDTPPPPTNKPTSPATTPLANTLNATPTSAHLSRAFVVHGIACSGPWTQKIQEVERAFGRRGGGVISVRYLLQGYRRRGKTFSLLVVCVKSVVQTAANMYVRVRGRKHKVEKYKWDRKSTKLDGWT